MHLRCLLLCGKPSSEKLSVLGCFRFCWGRDRFAVSGFPGIEGFRRLREAGFAACCEAGVFGLKLRAGAQPTACAPALLRCKLFGCPNAGSTSVSVVPWFSVGCWLQVCECIWGKGQWWRLRVRSRFACSKHQTLTGRPPRGGHQPSQQQQSLQPLLSRVAQVSRLMLSVTSPAPESPAPDASADVVVAGTDDWQFSLGGDGPASPARGSCRVGASGFSHCADSPAPLLRRWLSLSAWWEHSPPVEQLQTVPDSAVWQTFQPGFVGRAPALSPQLPSVILPTWRQRSAIIRPQGRRALNQGPTVPSIRRFPPYSEVPRDIPACSSTAILLH